MTTINPKEVYNQLKKTLSFYKYVLRLEDPNIFVTEIAKNISVFRTTESIIFHEEFVAKECPNNIVFSKMTSEIKCGWISLVYLLVDCQRPAFKTKGETSVKCVFDEKGSTQNAAVLKFVREKFDLMTLNLMMRDFLGVKRRQEIDLNPTRYSCLSHIVRFVANNKLEEEFPKLSDHIDRMLIDEESSNVINSNAIYYASNLKRFENNSSL